MVVVLLGSGRGTPGQPGRTLPPPPAESEVGTLPITGGGSHTPIGWLAPSAVPRANGQTRRHAANARACAGRRRPAALSHGRIGGAAPDARLHAGRGGRDR